jgi:manganese/zinc/iron transport system substrate-binding protein
MKKWMCCLLSIVLAACGQAERKDELSQWKENNGKIKVLTTIAQIADLVKAIGSDQVDALTLIKGELDPHSYQLVKGDDEKFAFAQLVFFNGLGLEHGPSLQQKLYHSSNAVSLGDKIKEHHPEQILHYKNQLDPHIWMDISLWAEAVPFIVEALSQHDPAHAQDYQQRGKQLENELAAAHREIVQLMEAIPEENRFLVTSHDAFNYFTRAYLSSESEKKSGGWQKRFAAPEGLAPESQLSATDIQEIIDHLAKYHIHVVFPESNVSKDSIRKIVMAAKEKGLNVLMADAFLYSDAMGRPGSDGDTYVKMIQHNAKTIARYLAQEKNHDVSP